MAKDKSIKNAEILTKATVKFKICDRSKGKFYNCRMMDKQQGQTSIQSKMEPFITKHVPIILQQIFVGNRLTSYCLIVCCLV